MSHRYGVSGVEVSLDFVLWDWKLRGPRELGRSHGGWGVGAGVCAHAEHAPPAGVGVGQPQISPGRHRVWMQVWHCCDRSADKSRNLYFYVKSPIFKC